jgi:hypothetical protein
MRKIILYLIILLPAFTLAQEKTKVLGQEAVRRVSVGADLYQDFWLDKPAGLDARAIHQGAGAYVQYNVPFGNSPLSFAMGIGVGMHNFYSDSRIADITADTIRFVAIPDSVSYKKSKLGLTYLDFPLELRFKAKNKVRFSAGVKLSYLLDAKTKYKGDNENGDPVMIKTRDVAQVDKFQFGPFVRVGYDWFQVFAYYSVTQTFEKNRGPDIYPISLGITLMPF